MRIQKGNVQVLIIPMPSDRNYLWCLCHNILALVIAGPGAREPVEAPSSVEHQCAALAPLPGSEIWFGKEAHTDLAGPRGIWPGACDTAGTQRRVKLKHRLGGQAHWSFSSYMEVMSLEEGKSGPSEVQLLAHVQSLSDITLRCTPFGFPFSVLLVLTSCSSITPGCDNIHWKKQIFSPICPFLLAWKTC